MKEIERMKKVIAVLAAVIMLLSLTVSFASADKTALGLGTMYVYTENGKTLNVRSGPYSGDNVIGHLPYGSAVEVNGFDGSWASIVYLGAPGGVAWVQSRYLQWYKPGPKPTPKPTTDPSAKQTEEELRSEVGIAQITVVAQASRSTGWVNMRTSPSKESQLVQKCPDGEELTAFAVTTNWYHVTNPATGNSGYIRKDFLKISPAPQPVVDEATRIGTLDVDGEFMLQGKIPEGYRLQIISSRKSKIVAVLVPDDTRRPQMMLTVAFDEMHADVERMNDLSEEDIDALKQTYTDMNEVEFSDAETASGTKLLIAKETGGDEDFASIISIYKGYSVEFVISPSRDALNRTLTDEQINNGINFLSDLDFIPAN